MKEYTHYVVTRFNITMFFGKESRDKNIIPAKTNLEDAYLEYRFSLFEQYTFPSLKNQTNSNFKWIVLFHAETPEKFKKKIEELQDEMKNFVPLFLDEGQSKDANKIIADYLRQDCRKDWIVTSRIDNDDFFEETYIETVQKYVEKHELKRYILSLPYGLQYDLRKALLLKYFRVTNHFITLVSRKEEEVNHITGLYHDKLRNYNIEIQSFDDGIPKWMEIVHEANQKNETRYAVANIIWNRELIKKYSEIPMDSKLDYLKYLGKCMIPSIIRLPDEVARKVYRKLKHKVY